MVLPFNRTEAAVALIEKHADELAAVILDPVPNRVGLIPAEQEFLAAIRGVTAAHGILLIFDEVISFRIGYQGAQGLFQIRPDITALGKIIGGGFPVGGVGGRADVMAVFDPRGGAPAVPHGGTFNANPVTMAAGLETMRLADREQFQRLDDLGAKLRGGIEDCFKHAGLPGRVTGVGSLFRIHGTDRELTDYRSTRLDATESQAFARLVRRLLERGALISPTGLGCVSTPMGDAELEWFLETFPAVCKRQSARVSGPSMTVGREAPTSGTTVRKATMKKARTRRRELLVRATDPEPRRDVTSVGLSGRLKPST